MVRHLRAPRSSTRPAWVLAVVALAVFIGNVDGTIMNVALPTLSRDLGATTTELQWIVDAFALVFSGFLFASGTLGDRFGRRRLLVTGLAVFGACSLAGAWSSSTTELIALRAGTGLGAALLFPATLAIISDVYRDPSSRAKAIGIWGAVAGLAVAIGPVLGGWLLEHFWWGSVLLVNVPICAVAIVAVLVVVPPSRDPDASKLDLGGGVLSVALVTTVVWTIIEAPDAGWSSTRTLVGFAVAVLLLGGFVVYEIHHASPMLDLRLFRSPDLVAATLAISIAFVALLGFIFGVSQYLQLVQGYSTLAAGVRIVPIAVAVAVSSAMAPGIAATFGARRAATAGLAVMAAGLGLATALSPTSGYGLVAAALVFIGFGVGLTTTPSTNLIMGAVPHTQAGVGSALNDATRELGGTFGVAILGSLLVSGYRQGVANLPSGTPPVARRAITDSLGSASTVAHALPAGLATRVTAQARQAFSTGFARSAAAGAALAAVAVIVLLITTRTRDGIKSTSGSAPPIRGRGLVMTTLNDTRNKAAIRRLLDAMYSADENRMATAIDEVFDPDVIFRTQLPVRSSGASAVKELLATLHRAFPDLHVAVEDLIEEGDKVVCRNTVTGTNDGEYMGRPPTGRSVTYDEIFVMRFTNGRITETWGVADVLSQMKQLGVLPTEPSAIHASTFARGE